MRIHHQDGSELAIENIQRVVKGKTGRMYMLYETPSGSKRIVEFSIEETAMIRGSRFEILEVPDTTLWQQFK